MTDADITPNELYEYLETGYIKHGVFRIGTGGELL
jgi:hypothetical protein